MEWPWPLRPLLFRCHCSTKQGMHFVHNTSSTEVIMVIWQSQKLVELEAVSQVKKLMVYGSYMVRSYIQTEDHSIIDESTLITLPGEIVQTMYKAGTYWRWYRDAAALSFPHCEILYRLLYNLVPRLLSGIYLVPATYTEIEITGMPNRNFILTSLHNLRASHLSHFSHLLVEALLTRIKIVEQWKCALGLKPLDCLIYKWV